MSFAFWRSLVGYTVALEIRVSFGASRGPELDAEARLHLCCMDLCDPPDGQMPVARTVQQLTRMQRVAEEPECQIGSLNRRLMALKRRA